MRYVTIVNRYDESLRVEHDQVIFLPYSGVLLAVAVNEGALPMNKILLEATLNGFSIAEHQPARAFLRVLPKLALVAHPVALYLIEISAVKGALERQWILVVEHSSSVELAVHPHAVVGWPALAVVEDAPAVDLAVLELSLVVGSICEHELAPPMLLACHHLSLVRPALLVCPIEELNLLQTAPHLTTLHLILPPGKALLALLEAQKTVLKAQVAHRSIFGGAVSGGRSESDVAYGIQDGLSLGIKERVFDGFLECALLQLGDILQILPDHLQQPRISVQVLLLLPVIAYHGLLLCAAHDRFCHLLGSGLGLLLLAAFLEVAVDGWQITEDAWILL